MLTRCKNVNKGQKFKLLKNLNLRFIKYQLNPNLDNVLDSQW